MDIYINDHGIEKSKFENHYRSYKYLKGLIKTVNDKRRYPRCIHGNNKKKKITIFIITIIYIIINFYITIFYIYIYIKQLK